jgi:hypothetical protein
MTSGVCDSCDGCDVCDAVRVGVDGRAGVGSLAGGGVGRFDSGTQLAKYLSSSSSVMSLKSLVTESAGEYSMVAAGVVLFVCFGLFSFFLSFRCACRVDG